MNRRLPFGCALTACAAFLSIYSYVSLSGRRILGADVREIVENVTTIYVELCGAFTGGPEALLQLYLALKRSTATNDYWQVKAIGDAPVQIYKEEYGSDRTKYGWSNDVLYPDADVSPDSIVVVPEIRACADVKERFPTSTIFIWLLQGGPVTGRVLAEGCNVLSHNFYIGRPYTGNPRWFQQDDMYIDLDLPDGYILTPYVTPSIVKEALAYTGMLSSGRLYVHSFESAKEDIIIIDSDALIIRDVRHYETLKYLVKSSIPGVRFEKASDMSRRELIELMKRAKVVYDDCMVGSERVPMEASLFGALLVTDWCNVGSSFADIPSPLKIDFASSAGSKDAYVQALAATFVRALENYDSLLPAFAPMRLLYSRLNERSLTAEVNVFLQTLRRDIKR